MPKVVTNKKNIFSFRNIIYTVYTPYINYVKVNIMELKLIPE